DLGRSSTSAEQLNQLLGPATTAVALAERGRSAAAAAAFGRLRTDALGVAIEEEQAAARGPSDLAQVADWAALLAAGAGALLGVALVRPWWRRRTETTGDEQVEKLAAEARTDSLTGLGNHRAFNETLSVAIDERATTNTPFVLLAIDLDGLKRINDSE